MSKKPKVVALIDCSYCHKQSHILLKLSDKPKIEVVSCMFCREQMEVAYETVANVMDVAAMRPHLRRDRAKDLLPNMRAVASGKLNDRWPPVSRAIGATWHPSALIGSDDV